MLDDLKQQHRVEGAIRKWQKRIHGRYRQLIQRRTTQIIQVNIAAEATISLLGQRHTVGPIPAPEVKNASAGVLRGKADEGAIVFAWACRHSRLIEVVASRQRAHVLPVLL